VTTTATARTLSRPGPWSRLAGLGTIYGKTVRDSLRAALVVGGVASLFMFGTGAPYGLSPDFATVALRQQFVDALTALPPALRGLLGEPINLLTMGGFLSWRVGNTLPVLLARASLVAADAIFVEASKLALRVVAARIDEKPAGQRGIREGERAKRVHQRRPQTGAPRILERWIRGSRRGR
jgi:hypothetical protein